MPRWARGGQTLFYRGADGRLREVDLRVSQAGAAPQVQVLAERTLEVEIPPSDNLRYHAYAAAPDGQRFLVNAPTDAPLAPTTVVLNWQSAMGQ